MREDATPCAVKVLEPEAINHQYLAYCLNKVLSLPGHPGLVPVFEFHDDDIHGPAYYVMALLAERVGRGKAAGLEGRTIESLCGQLPPVTAWSWIAQIAEGCAFLHTHAIVHCNLKPSNVFLTAGEDPSPQVSDFGQGWMAGVEALPLSDHVFYAPPEQLREPMNIQLGSGERWDVYAFGVLAYRLLTGRFPRGDSFARRLKDPEKFGEVPDPDEFAGIAQSESAITWPRPAEYEVEERRRQVLEKCLRIEPLERWVDMREVRDALAAVDHDLAEAARWAQARAEKESLLQQLEAARVRRGETQTTVKRVSDFRLWLAGSAAAAAALAALWLTHSLMSTRASLNKVLSERGNVQTEARTALDQRDATLKAREAELAQASAALASAVSAERMARDNLAGAQTAADHFFESFLDAARQLPPSSGQERGRLLVSAYDYFNSFIETNATLPEMAEACLRARCHLAEIKLAMDAGLEAAEKFDEARTHINQWLAQKPAHERAAEFRVKAADCALAASKLRLAGGQPPPAAREQLKETLATLREAAKRDPAPQLRRRQAEALFLLAQNLTADVTSHGPETLRLLNQAADLLNGLLAETKSAKPEDRLTLARVYLERGKIERVTGKIERALATQVETAELLLECGDDPAVLYQLARCYGETGEMLENNAEHRDAARAHGEAIKILSDLAKSAPHHTEYHFHLAMRYSDIASILRANAEAARALDYQKGAVEILKALVERDAGNAVYAAQLARRKADLSDLLVTLGQKPEALVQAREAVALLDKLKAPGRPASSAEYDLKLNIAHSYGVAGHVTEEVKQAAEAAQCFSRAVAEYESLAGSVGRNDTIDRGLTWSRMRLAKLKN